MTLRILFFVLSHFAFVLTALTATALSLSH
jgi:hypothetical protein